MRLDEDTVDLFEVHNAGLVADGLDEGSQAGISDPMPETSAGANDDPLAAAIILCLPGSAPATAWQTGQTP